ncbi:MAG: DUF4244 domain-containing protein [Cellulomonas sp.]|nr:DUF4244 domain-containing protein [Cellulomonas sp.]
MKPIRRSVNLRLRGSRAVAQRGSGRSRRLGRRCVAHLARTRDSLGDAGMATAEYAIVTLAAVGFAGLLLVILKSGEVRDLLVGIIRTALSA